VETISAQHQEALPVHNWQQEILDERERLIEKGEAEFVDWEEAKRRITRETTTFDSTPQMP